MRFGLSENCQKREAHEPGSYKGLYTHIHYRVASAGLRVNAAHMYSTET